MADEMAPPPASAETPADLAELGGLAAPPPAEDPARAATSPSAAAPLPASTPVAIASPDERMPVSGPDECPRCGASRDHVTNRCPECGYRYLVRCPKCGAVNDGEATACASCGHHLISAAHGAWTVGPQRPGPPPRVSAMGYRARGGAAKRHGLKPRRRVHSPLFFLILATGAIVLALGLLIAYLLLSQDPRLLGDLGLSMPIRL